MGCEAKSQLKLDLCRKKQHAAEALAGSARARLQACTSFRAKTTTLMGHMAKAEATFQKCRKMLKIDEAKLSKTMQTSSGRRSLPRPRPRVWLRVSKSVNMWPRVLRENTSRSSSVATLHTMLC